MLAGESSLLLWLPLKRCKTVPHACTRVLAWVEVCVHKVVSQQHLQVCVNSQCHNLCVDGMWLLHEHSHAATCLKALNQHGAGHKARDGAGDGHTGLDACTSSEMCNA